MAFLLKGSFIPIDQLSDYGSYAASLYDESGAPAILTYDIPGNIAAVIEIPALSYGYVHFTNAHKPLGCSAEIVTQYELNVAVHWYEETCICDTAW